MTKFHGGKQNSMSKIAAIVATAGLTIKKRLAHTTEDLLMQPIVA